MMTCFLIKVPSWRYTGIPNFQRKTHVFGGKKIHKNQVQLGRKWAQMQGETEYFPLLRPFDFYIRLFLYDFSIISPICPNRVRIISVLFPHGVLIVSL